MAEGEALPEEFEDLPLEEEEKPWSHWKLIALLSLAVAMIIIALGFLRYWMVGYYGSG